MTPFLSISENLFINFIFYNSENQDEKEDRQRLENIKKKQEARKLKKEAKKQKEEDTVLPQSSATPEKKTAQAQFSEAETTEKTPKEKPKEKEAKTAAETANKEEKPQTKGKKEKPQIKQTESKKEGAPEKPQLGLENEQTQKKSFLKNPLDRIERGKGKQRKMKKILQSKDTWERINDSMNFEEDEQN